MPGDIFCDKRLQHGSPSLFKLRAFGLLEGDYPVKEHVLCEKDFGRTTVLDLKPEVLGPLWLMTSASDMESGKSLS